VDPTLPSDSRITSFTVDTNGNLTQKVCPELCTTQFRYDASHQATAAIDSTGAR
jgi:YD repeat-containing protein